MIIKTILKFSGTLLILASVVFVIWETNHFGNNWLPGSYTEFLCDTAAFIGVWIGIALVYLSKKL